MAKSDSVQKRLQKIRAPRVQMTYDVEIGDAIENKELPFVVGVLGDFGGNPDSREKAPEGPQVRQHRPRQFRRSAGRRGAGGAASRVPNHLSEEGGTVRRRAAVSRRWTTSVRNRWCARSTPLRKLLEARTKLADLRNKLAGNDKLEDILNDVLNNTEKLASLEPAVHQRRRIEMTRPGRTQQSAQPRRRPTDIDLLDQIVEQSQVAKSSAEHARAQAT